MLPYLPNMLEEPTEKNICRALQEDRCGRVEQVCQFADMLCSLDRNCVLALDGKWGSGKTFFVKEVKQLLDAAASGEDIPVGERGAGLYATLGNKQHVATLYYDAWAHDTDAQPMLSILNELMADERINRCLVDNDKLLPSLLQVAQAVTTLAAPEHAAALLSLTALTNGALATVKEFRNALSRKKDTLGARLPELFQILLEATQTQHIVFFIDELDRCRPDFAVRLLEVMKHYFTSQQVIFVLSINREQLCHTIRKHYGEGFDASFYLNKFFDMVFTLPQLPPGAFREQFGAEYKTGFSHQIIDGVMSYYQRSLREQIRYCETLYSHRNVSNSILEYFSFEGQRMAGLAILPIILGMGVCDKPACQAFLDGESCDNFIKIVNSMYNLPLDTMFDEILPEKSTFYVDARGNGKHVVSFRTAFTQFYKAAFQYERLEPEEQAKIDHEQVDKYRHIRNFLLEEISNF